MMKLLIISNSSSGLYGIRKELIHELKKKYSILILSPNDGRMEELKYMSDWVSPLKIDRRGVNCIREIRLFFDILTKVLSVCPDMVITYTIKPNIYAGIICRINHIKHCANITGLGTSFYKKGILRRIIIALYRVALKKTKVVFFENSVNKGIFIKEKIIKASKACVLNGAGVNLEYFNYQKYPKVDNPVSFLFIGRLMREKGIEELFQACRRLNNENYSIRLHILGGYEEDYRLQVDTYMKEGWLIYHGVKDNVRPYLAKTHCVILPSWHEGMANTNLEAAASGRPVITSNIPGCREAVIDGISGLYCKPRNVLSIYQAMKKFIVMDNSERECLGIAGRNHMERVFDRKKVVKESIDRMTNELNKC